MNQNQAQQAAIADALANQSRLRPQDLEFVEKAAEQLKAGQPLSEPQQARLSLIWNRLKGIT